jgi:hypothetical protein
MLVQEAQLGQDIVDWTKNVISFLSSREVENVVQQHRMIGKRVRTYTNSEST